MKNNLYNNSSTNLISSSSWFKKKYNRKMTILFEENIRLKVKDFKIHPTSVKTVAENNLLKAPKGAV